MRYRLLGKLRIGDDHPLDLPGGHTLTVLAALLINANQRMSKTELLQAAWGSDEVSEAQLHKAISTVRDLLGQIGRRDDLITHARQGYEFQAAADDLDMLAFKRLTEQADKARADRRADDEVSFLREALRLWRGPHPLANVPNDAFKQEVDHLEQRRKRAAVRLFDLELARGGYDRILDELTLIAGYYPDDGRLTEQLMIASYRCGHVTDATAAYERHTAALAEETGGPPDRALRDMYYAIAGGNDDAVQAAESEMARHAGVPGAGGAAIANPAIPRQLPPEPAYLIGRDDLVAEARWVLGRQPRHVAPVVVICGPGGIGKTALARRAARVASASYPDGQLYLELRGTAGQRTEPGDALAQFLRALGAQVVPDGLAERIAKYRTLLADRQVLVVLDDAADGAQIRDLIPASPGCGVLITTRRRLPDVDGAHHMAPLGPLSRADATQLFLRVAQNSGIDLQRKEDGVDEVVALCGGLPLAVRIAAALRVRDHPRPAAELAARLAGQGPEALTYGELSVARTIGAGYERLDDQAKQLFLKLGLLALPGFGQWTVAALAGAPGSDAVAALSQLTASYVVEPGEHELRYRFHDLTREYAARRARSQYPGQDDRTAVLTQAYEALLTLTRRAHAQMSGGDFEVVHSAVPDWAAPAAVLEELDADPSAWFEKERLNIRAAVGHCAELGLTEICWDLAVSAHELFNRGRYLDDWRATHLVALRACQAAGDQRGEGIVLACLGQPDLVASGAEGAVSLDELERAVELLAASGDRHGQAIAQRTLGNALRRRGHLARPLKLFTEALAGYETSGDTVGESQTLRYIGWTHLDSGDNAAALEVFSRAQAVAAKLDDRHVLAQTTYLIGQARLAAGDSVGAVAAFEEMLEVYPEPAGIGHAYAEHGLGEVALRTGKLTDAQRYLDLAARLASEGFNGVLEGRVSQSAAGLAQARGQQAKRLVALQRAADCFAGCGAAYLEAGALAALAEALEDVGDAMAALAAWGRIDDLYQKLEVPAEDRVYRRSLLANL